MASLAQEARGRLRIAVVSAAYPTRDSIAGVFVADQVAALRTRHDVQVISPIVRGWRGGIVDRGRATRTVEDASDVLRPMARQWIPRSSSSLAAAHVRAVRTALARLWRQAAPDVIHAHGIFPAGFAAVTIGRRLGIPVVVTEHAGPFIATVPSRAARDAARWTMDRAAAVLAVSPRLRGELLEIAPGRSIDIVENVVDTEFFHAPSTPDRGRPSPLRLFSLGIQAPQKAIEILLAAVALLAADGVETELVVGGDGPERPGLEAETRSLALASSVSFVGLQQRHEVRERYWWSDMYVSASRHESFGLAIAEAMACTRPVVVTRSGGPDTFVRPGEGVLVPCDDAAALASAIKDVAAGRIRLDLPKARQTIVERFGVPTFLAAVEAVYERVLAGARRQL